MSNLPKIAASVLPSLKELASFYFRLSREDGSHPVEPIKLNLDGSIYGYIHPNESKWLLINGHVSFLREDGVISTTFDEISMSDGKLLMVGTFLLNGKGNIRHKLEQIEYDWDSRDRPAALTRLHLALQANKYHWDIGDHTYGVPKVLEPAMAKLSIGKFCSIAGEVVIILGNHRTNTATTYPFKALRKYWPGIRTERIEDHITNGDVEIGNDVWIGYRAVIMSGVKIGSGAIIAANSVVNKDVPPYAIVGGTPAKIIRYRHADEQIKALLKITWWDWSDEVIDSRLPILLSDINVFISIFGNTNKQKEDLNG
ncbi:CatB-related O-acetyltransferase [Pantoea sp. LMR881]|uniref:CatB-related O-acetyltransferase n=1 Tax=Pantoea sp. LMR881 TaxID=3014336 RepID=UPI0022AFE476|nr:CatB-related O-acetyltransferase [Pantoea sp. LMR881]MCZ4058018.1 CatB-related O-acetyltransferase [Pantoea sp. LMR881]